MWCSFKIDSGSEAQRKIGISFQESAWIRMWISRNISRRLTTSPNFLFLPGSGIPNYKILHQE